MNDIEQKVVSVNGLNIAYLEKNPSIPETIFFIHGNSCSSRMWKKQFESERLAKYRLIAIDLPGHGQSSSSKNPDVDYSPIGTSSILSSAIKQMIKANPYVLVGFSYGTNLVAETLKDLRPQGAMLVGSCVTGEGYGLEKVFLRQETPSIFFYNEKNREFVATFMQEHLKHEIDIQKFVEDYLKVSDDFKPTLFKTVEEGKISDEVHILQNFEIPICIVFGRDDEIVNVNYLDSLPFSIWKNEIFKLRDAGHVVNVDVPDTFNQILAEYVQEIFYTKPCLTA
jgi:pimeloyl-ACP methyl ester carboxylesterase